MKRSLQLNPDNRPATWEKVRDWRDWHEVAPVITSFGDFDADERSEARMAGSIEQFDNLPTLGQDGKLAWKRADNSFIALTKADLQTVYAELKANRAARGAVLHARAEEFRQMGPMPTAAQLADLSYWLG